MNDHDLRVALARIEERINGMKVALELQAKEYERRLADLNHAHQQAVAKDRTFVSQDKYEDKLAAEAEARETALLRLDERFAEHVKRWEQRDREVEQALTIQKTASDAAKQFAADAQMKAQQAVTEASARANVRIGAVAVFLTVVIIVMNLVGVGA